MASYIKLDIPIIETIVKTYTKFLIKNITVNVNSSATIIVLVSSNDGDIISRIIQMNGDDYANWSSDDNYVIEFIKMKLGLEEFDSGIY